ncbi:MAG: AraC family transcriptional regulator [Spirosomataceae bacterium]
MEKVYQEVTPLSSFDCYTLFQREKTYFDFPLHAHAEMEINLILGGAGVRRAIGDHEAVITNEELVLVGSFIPHTWFTNEFPLPHSRPVMQEITLQFHPDLLEDSFLARNQMVHIQHLWQRSAKGMAFFGKTFQKASDQLIELTTLTGFDSILGLLALLHTLADSTEYRLLTSSGYRPESFVYRDERIERVFAYLHAHYTREISLAEIAQVADMAPISFGRLLKKSTGKTFIDILQDIRIGYAIRQLLDTPLTIAEIAYQCGFNHASYFNRIFREKKGCTPKAYRENMGLVRKFV